MMNGKALFFGRILWALLPLSLAWVMVGCPLPETSMTEVAVHVEGRGIGRVVGSDAGVDCHRCYYSFKTGIPIYYQDVNPCSGLPLNYSTQSCDGLIAPGQTVTLSAVPDNGYRFAGWSGLCSGTGACRVSSSQAGAVAANFAEVSDGGVWNFQGRIVFPDSAIAANHAGVFSVTVLGHDLVTRQALPGCGTWDIHLSLYHARSLVTNSLGGYSAQVLRSDLREMIGSTCPAADFYLSDVDTLIVRYLFVPTASDCSNYCDILETDPSKNCLSKCLAGDVLFDARKNVLKSQFLAAADSSAKIQLPIDLQVYWVYYQ